MIGAEVTIAHAGALSEAERAMVIGPLDAYSTARGFPYDSEPVSLVLGRDGAVLGGLLGSIVWDWFHVEILSITESLRGRGYGRRLMAMAEDVARHRGCIGVWVDTTTFQAPGFYQKIGFELFGELPDHPRGQSRLFFRKRL